MSMDIMARNVGTCLTSFSKGIGVFTTGNAIAMAWYRYPRGFKFYRNTASFVPKPGDFAVWGTASFNNGVGHTAVVVGPSNRSYFTSVDQNWRNANGYTGSPGSLEKHSYYGISGFVRPPYQKEVKRNLNQRLSLLNLCLVHRLHRTRIPLNKQSQQQKVKSSIH